VGGRNGGFSACIRAAWASALAGFCQWQTATITGRGPERAAVNRHEYPPCLLALLSSRALYYMERNLQLVATRTSVIKRPTNFKGERLFLERGKQS
jgi:hypothetical protein